MSDNLRPDWAGTDQDVADFYDWGYWTTVNEMQVKRQLKNPSGRASQQSLTIVISKVFGVYVLQVSGRQPQYFPSAMLAQQFANAIAWSKDGWATACKRCIALGKYAPADIYCSDGQCMKVHEVPRSRYWNLVAKAAKEQSHWDWYGYLNQGAERKCP